MSPSMSSGRTNLNAACPGSAFEDARYPYLDALSARAKNLRLPAACTWMAAPLLILFTESLDVRSTVRIEEFLAHASLSSGVVMSRSVRHFLVTGAQALAEIFHSGPPE